MNASPGNTESRITPTFVTQLGPDEIFVFGSNAHGFHGAGAAKIAVEKFGAVMGQGHGLQGQSYAIDTMSGRAVLEQEVRQFCAVAKTHPQKQFLVTPVGCGIAGYRPEDVAPLFLTCKALKNVSLPQVFWNVIGFPGS